MGNYLLWWQLNLQKNILYTSTIMNPCVNPNWISSNFQARIEPPPIPFENSKEEIEHKSHIVKVSMRHNPTSLGSEIYKFKMTIFENDQTEELLQFLKNFKKAVNGTCNTAVIGRIYYLQILIRGEVLREFDILSRKKNSTTSAQLKEIQQGLLG